VPWILVSDFIRKKIFALIHGKSNRTQVSGHVDPGEEQQKSRSQEQKRRRGKKNYDS